MNTRQQARSNEPDLPETKKIKKLQDRTIQLIPQVQPLYDDKDNIYPSNLYNFKYSMDDLLT
jgi:hypothetical protein